VRLEDLVGGEDAASGEGWEPAIAARVSVEHAVEALGVLAALPEHERHDLALFVGGFCYEKTAQLGGRGRS